MKRLLFALLLGPGCLSLLGGGGPTSGGDERGTGAGRSWIVALAGDDTPRWLQPVGEPWASATDLGPVIATSGIGTAIDFAGVPLGAADVGSLVLGSFGP